MVAVSIPQVVTEVSASGAQVIDGSLVFIRNNVTSLKRTPGSAGNRKTWSWSGWLKRGSIDTAQFFFGAGPDGSNDTDQITIFFEADNQLRINTGNSVYLETTQVFRDIGWYHFLIATDTTLSTANDRVKLYVNGSQVTAFDTRANPTQDSDTGVNSATEHKLGESTGSTYAGSSYTFDGRMAQVYLIDGQALDPSEFGYTDPLTNTWRPKKYSGTFGTNGSYLPLDGNSPIGRDQSGKGNDWTPVNFGGSNIIPKATGALPILNTGNGGTFAIPGFRGQAGIAVTVFDSGSGNKYYLDGIETPSLDQYRGQTVTFDLSDSTCASHPFRFSTTSDGTHDSGTEYSEGKQEGGTPGSVGAATTITYPHNAPDTLYYYCGTHSGMGGSGSVELSTDVQKADPYAWRNVLALPLVGNSVDVGIACTSTTKTITETGTPTASTTTSNFYGTSYYFDGSGDYLAVTDSTDLKFGTGDYTIEFWVRMASVAYYWMFSKRNDYSDVAPYTMMANTSGQFEYASSSNDSGYNIVSASFGSYKANEWTHVAVVKNGGVITGYCNGVGTVLATGVTLGPFEHAEPLHIGDMPTGGSYDLSGYMQDFCIYKGVAKYVNDFIPASTSPDILPDTPSGVVYGSELTKVTDGAVVFGTWAHPGNPNKYLTVSDSADFTFGSDDFTLEAFVNYTDNTTYSTIITKYTTDNASSSWMFAIYDDLVRFFFFHGSSSLSVASSIDIPERTWVHCVVTRDGNTIRIFQDGMLVATGDVTGLTMNDSSVALTIGSDGDQNYDLDGVVSNARVIKADIPTDYKTSTTTVGTQVFTPPSAPLTDITNTKLLCCQSPTSATDAAVKPATMDWQPSGFTYWSDGMDANWSQSGSTTSGTADYINVALPTSGKYYWESTLNNPSEYREIGLQQGADKNDGYDGKYFGFYFNQVDKEALFLTKNEDNTSRDGAVINGATASGGGFSNGEKIMWAWDADNDKVWLGRDGTWFASGDPATGANASIDGEDLSANTWYFKIGYNNESGATNTLTLTNVTSASSTNYDPVATGAVATTLNPFTDDINTVMGPPTGYATLNPLMTSGTLTDGNLTHPGSAAGNSSSSIKVGSGKWYAEVTLDTAGHMGFGWSYNDIACTPWICAIAGYYMVYNSGTTLQLLPGGSSTLTSGTGTLARLVPWQMCIDVDNNKAYLGDGTTWYNDDWNQTGSPGNPVTGDNPTFTLPAGKEWYFWIYPNLNGASKIWMNFGQKPLKYAPPEGYKLLNYANLPSPGVVRPDQYVGITTYTGLGDGAVNAKDVLFDFDPDLCWLKMRSAVGEHYLWDTVRSFGNNGLNSSAAQAEGYQSAYYTISKINKGFNIIQVNPGNEVNYAGNTYVSWAWKAGGNKNTFNVDDVGYASAAAAGLDGGTLTVTGASVGTKQGFSIIKFTGTGVAGSVSHGLTQKPDFILAKNVDVANDWPVHHSSLTGPTYTMYLNGNALAAAETLIWPSASTDSVINVGSGSVINGSGNSTIIYAWHNVPGMQKFGSYEGNNVADGTFVELGFRPALVIFKNIDASEDWMIVDDNRSRYNPVQPTLYPNEPDIESSATNRCDFLSNGFKLRSGTSIPNTANTYIYAAFAESPMNGFYGAQSNAR